VLDARDPMGTRCRFLENHIRKHLRHKHLLLLLNKCDLVGVTATGGFVVMVVGCRSTTAAPMIENSHSGSFSENIRRPN
jgi:ribosome biogenesis GTPase A